MSDIGDMWKAMRERQRQEAQERRCRAAKDFSDAEFLASCYGLRLVRHTDFHFMLETKEKTWRKHIYPGKQRIAQDNHLPHGPFLDLTKGFSLMRIVEAAIKANRPDESQSGQPVNQEYYTREQTTNDRCEVKQKTTATRQYAQHAVEVWRSVSEKVRSTLRRLA